jgi:diacylglycerol kinase
MISGGSLFSQVLSLVDRVKFQQAIKEHQTEKSAKGFSSWSQFVSLLFSQFAGANSLREISGGLATIRGKINHLGLSSAPRKSTLSYANTHRPWQFFETIFYRTLAQVQSLSNFRRTKFRFKNPLYSIDSSVIDLCLKVFDWAHFRRTKGAVKLHLLLDHAGYLPCWAYLSDGKCADIKAARLLKLPAGAIVVMDRGYNDYRLFGAWCDRGVYFVTRMKDRTDYQVVASKVVAPDKDIVADEMIKFNSSSSQKKCPHHLRLVSFYNAEKDEVLYFLTNNFKLAASTIAAIYKERWQIELFFKAIKQNLKVKTFLGTSENAVKSQLWTALLAMLMMKYLQLKSRFGWSLSNLAALLRINLLTYRDLWEWIDKPFSTAVLEPLEQPRLFPA